MVKEPGHHGLLADLVAAASLLLSLITPAGGALLAAGCRCCLTLPELSASLTADSLSLSLDTITLSTSLLLYRAKTSRTCPAAFCSLCR